MKNSLTQNEFSDMRGENSEYILNNILNIASNYIQNYYDFIKREKI